MTFGRIIILEGNISAGKSTLCGALKKSSPNVQVFFEPTTTNPYLERFYADPSRYALKMQTWLFRQRYLTYLKALRFVMETGYDAILDRSVYSDWVFAHSGFLDGNITLEGYQYYMALRQHLLAELPLPHFTVYLRVAPETCYSRIHFLRKRGCESSIPLEYLQGLHVCYERLLKELNERGSLVLTFDWNSFGSATQVSSQLDRYKFEYSQPQWDRVHSLLEQLDHMDLNAHLWPEHLSEQAAMFDEQEESHDSFSTMEGDFEQEEEREKEREEEGEFLMGMLEEGFKGKNQLDEPISSCLRRLRTHCSGGNVRVRVSGVI